MEPTWFGVVILFFITVGALWGVIKFLAILPAPTEDPGEYRATVSRGKIEYNPVPVRIERTGFEWLERLEEYDER